jgi:hypothetical protein
VAAIVYLETAPGSGLFNRRGEVGQGDNPDSFARLMGIRGLRVLVVGEDAGVRDVPLADLEGGK